MPQIKGKRYGVLQPAWDWGDADIHQVTVPRSPVESESVGSVKVDLERIGRVQKPNKEVRNCSLPEHQEWCSVVSWLCFSYVAEAWRCFLQLHLGQAGGMVGGILSPRCFSFVTVLNLTSAAQ